MQGNTQVAEELPAKCPINMQQPETLVCCKDCKHWHKRNNYGCQHNGPYGGGSENEGCAYKPIQEKKGAVWQK
jgi:hypothetical protein